MPLRGDATCSWRSTDVAGSGEMLPDSPLLLVDAFGGDMTAEDEQSSPGNGAGPASDESKRDLPGSAPEDRQDHSRDDVSENKCPECDEPVHEKRVSCPNCGREYTEDDYTTDPEPDEFSTEDASFMEEGGGSGEQGVSDRGDHADDGTPPGGGSSE